MRNVGSNLRYVLLLGDVDQITPENINGICTDHYYFTPRDSDPNKKDYVLAWVSGGRIPIRNASEAMCVINQIIQYEKNPPIDLNYYNRIVTAAYFQDDSQQDGREDRAYLSTMEGIRNHLVSVGKEVDRVYVSNNPNPLYYKDGTPIPQEVKNSIVNETTATQMLVEATNQGHLIIGHRDHGGASGWVKPSFGINNLSQITSTVPSIFYSVNCQTGSFDSTNPSQSFAEEILAKNGAAPSLIAATRNSGTWRNDSLIKAMFDAMFPGVLPTFPGNVAAYAIKNNRLGDILNYGMSYLPIAHSGDISGIREHTEIYHVIGDPTLELWGQKPKDIFIKASIKASVKGSKLIITLSECPQGGYLSLWIGNRLVKGIHPQSSNIAIPLNELVLLQILDKPLFKKITICFAKFGYHFASIPVTLPVLTPLAYPELVPQ